jgi:hypothetical protein
MSTGTNNSTQYILDVENMTLDGKPLVINEEYYNFIFYMLSKTFNTNQQKKNIKSPVIPMINYNLYNIFSDIFSPHFDKEADKPKEHNDKSDINIIKLSSSELMLRNNLDFYFMDDIKNLEKLNSDLITELSKPVKDLYTKNTTIGSNKPYMNIIMIINQISTGNVKIKDELLLLNPIPPNLTIYLYISDNFETNKLKVINKTKKLYKIYDSGIFMPFSEDGETIDYKVVDFNKLKCPNCYECKKCPESNSCPNCPDIKPYTYGLYGSGALIFILLAFLFYNMMKDNKEAK